jgi:hypothetical protein
VPVTFFPAESVWVTCTVRVLGSADNRMGTPSPTMPWTNETRRLITIPIYPSPLGRGR